MRSGRTALVDLFRTKFFDTVSGTLAEYFNDDWSRAPGEDGRMTEPGHQMEWAWILNSARKLLGRGHGKRDPCGNRVRRNAWRRSGDSP